MSYWHTCKACLFFHQTFARGFLVVTAKLNSQSKAPLWFGHTWALSGSPPPPSEKPLRARMNGKPLGSPVLATPPPTRSLEQELGRQKWPIKGGGLYPSQLGREEGQRLTPHQVASSSPIQNHPLPVPLAGMGADLASSLCALTMAEGAEEGGLPALLTQWPASEPECSLIPARQGLGRRGQGG